MASGGRRFEAQNIFTIFYDGVFITFILALDVGRKE
jgi:hypothetical protein